MLVELLRPLGPELARRWLAALLAIPAHEREAAVAAIESRVAEAYEQRLSGSRKKSRKGRSFDVLSPPVQKDGYTEQVVTTYDLGEPGVGQGSQSDAKRRRRSAGA